MHSHLAYGTHIWGLYLNKTQINKIESERRKAIRYISGTNYRVNYDDLHKKYGFLKLENIIKLVLLKLAYKLNNNILPENNNFF